MRRLAEKDGSMTGWYSRNAFLAGWLTLALVGAAFAADPADKMSELERYIRIQIEIGAAMKEFFSTMGPGSGSPPPEKREAMVAQIDQTVASILKKYGLTTDEYNARKREVFRDQEAVDAFLAQHPDLKTQWEALPFKGGGGHGRSRPPAE
jgi:hypothetical protein